MKKRRFYIVATVIVAVLAVIAFGGCENLLGAGGGDSDGQQDDGDDDGNGDGTGDAGTVTVRLTGAGGATGNYLFVYAYEEGEHNTDMVDSVVAAGYAEITSDTTEVTLQEGVDENWEPTGGDWTATAGETYDLYVYTMESDMETPSRSTDPWPLQVTVDGDELVSVDYDSMVPYTVSDGTLTVTLDGASEVDGSTILCVVTTAGTSPDESDPLAMGEAQISSGEAEITLQDQSGAEWEGSAGTEYDLYVIIDADGYQGSGGPTAGDYILDPLPMTYWHDGDRVIDTTFPDDYTLVSEFVENSLTVSVDGAGDFEGVTLSVGVFPADTQLGPDTDPIAGGASPINASGFANVICTDMQGMPWSAATGTAYDVYIFLDVDANEHPSQGDPVYTTDDVGDLEPYTYTADGNESVVTDGSDYVPLESDPGLDPGTEAVTLTDGDVWRNVGLGIDSSSTWFLVVDGGVIETQIESLMARISDQAPPEGTQFWLNYMSFEPNGFEVVSDDPELGVAAVGHLNPAGDTYVLCDQDLNDDSASFQLSIRSEPGADDSTLSGDYFVAMLHSDTSQAPGFFTGWYDVSFSGGGLLEFMNAVNDREFDDYAPVSPVPYSIGDGGDLVVSNPMVPEPPFPRDLFGQARADGELFTLGETRGYPDTPDNTYKTLFFGARYSSNATDALLEGTWTLASVSSAFRTGDPTDFWETAYQLTLDQNGDGTLVDLDTNESEPISVDLNSDGSFQLPPGSGDPENEGIVTPSGDTLILVSPRESSDLDYNITIGVKNP
jgi:hypothetical protein